MTDPVAPFGLPFPLCFLGLWLAITTLFGLFSGWYRLMLAYPDIPEVPLYHVRCSALMGLVSMSGILTLSALPSGLRISMFRAFGPFNRPFVIPWRDLAVAAGNGFMIGPSVKLIVGLPRRGSLTIPRRSWDDIQKAAPQGTFMFPPLPPVDVQRAALNIIIQTLLVVAVAATFFYFASRGAGGPDIPIEIAIGFPALVFGGSGLFRLLLLRRYRRR